MVRGLGRGFINGGLLCVATFAAGACTVTSTSTNPDAGATGLPDGSPKAGDAGPGSDGATGTGAFAFTPSNISLDGIDVSAVVDEDLSSNCELDTGTGPTAGGTCLKNPVETILTQAIGT